MSTGLLLHKARELFYRGYLRRAFRRVGLHKLFSDSYWKLVHKLSDNVQTHTIGEQRINFKAETHAEFKRFQTLAGERPILKDVIRSIKSDDVFYDIGANVGTYTCFASSKLISGETVAFEPEPHNVEQLRANINFNRLDAEIVEVALSDADGTVDFALSGEEAGEGQHAIATGQEQVTIKVKMARGDKLIEQRGLATPTVLKIDVEGAELSVLRGLRETLREHVRLVYVEVHPDKLPKYGDSQAEVRAFLEEAGFDLTELPTQREHIFLRASK